MLPVFFGVEGAEGRRIEEEFIREEVHAKTRRLQANRALRSAKEEEGGKKKP
jgi:hypothetical protein